MTEAVWPAGVKRTKQRESVLDILENAAEPLSAMDIYARLEKDRVPIWLSTVYRVLELFTEKGIVVRTTVPGSDMAYYERNRHGHHHYAVCVDCHKIVAIDNCPMTDFKPRLSDDEFRVLGHRVEMYGYCRACDKRNKTKSEEV